MNNLALLGALAVLAFLVYRFIVPYLRSHSGARSAVNSSLKEQSRLEAMLPEDATHASLNEVYLTDDVRGVQDGTVLMAYDPDVALIVATPELFLIIGGEGEILFSTARSSLALGLPEGFDDLGDDGYYYFLFMDEGLALATRCLKTVRVAGKGDAILGHWDVLVV